MRACYLLLVAATTLLAAVSATTDADNTKLSQMTTSDTIQSIDAAQAATTKRFLRRYKVTEEDEGSEDDLEDEESDDNTEDEERGAINQLDDVVGDVTKLLKNDDAVMQFLSTKANKVKDLGLVQRLFNSGISENKLDDIIKAMALKAAANGGTINFDADKIKKSFHYYTKLMGVTG
ncbi:hypothetical protein PRIC1_006089 [Phytophthora ramorum]